MIITYNLKIYIVKTFKENNIYINKKWKKNNLTQHIMT